MSQEISIITVCYNSEKTIAETFESVLAQTLLPYEYIVVDGASKDKTLKIIANYKQKFESKNVIFKYISEPDKGLYDAMNKAIKLITGKWVHYLNSDDYYNSSTVLEKINNILVCNNEDIIYGNIVVCYKNGKKKIQKPGLLPRRITMYFRCPIQQPAAFIRCSLLENYSFDTNYRNSADYKLWVKLICNGAKYKYVNINITIFNVGGASGNLSNLNKENIRLFKELSLPLGALIHSFYIHLRALSYLKKRYPNLHQNLKHLIKGV